MRRIVLLLSFVLLATTLAPLADAQGSFLGVCVNTTGDLTVEPNMCLAGNPCTFRAALMLMDGKQATVTACFDPSVVPNAKPCPDGCLPLEADEEDEFDEATGQYILTYAARGNELSVMNGNLTVDFAHLLEGWESPADNRIVLDPDLTIDPDEPKLSHVLSVTGSDATFKGFQIRGTYSITAILVKEGAANNQFGPGLVLSGLHEGAGILFQDSETVGNRVVGSWCGLGGDGSTIEGIRDDCVKFERKSRANTVGGTSPEDRNVLSGSELGAGVMIDGTSARDNVIEGNWIGLTADGSAAAANEVGVRVTNGTTGTVIRNNTISGNESGGIALFTVGAGTVIEGNVIGRDSNGDKCVANGTAGIRMQGEVPGAEMVRNTIHCNEGAGVSLIGPLVRGRLTENSITRNRGPGIEIQQGANDDMKPPLLTDASSTFVEGVACPECTVEVFSDPGDEAAVYEGTVTAGPEGKFRFDMPAGEAFSFINVRTTGTIGKVTSPLSEPVLVPPQRTPTATSFYSTPTNTPMVTPTDRATATPQDGTFIYLPRLDA